MRGPRTSEAFRLSMVTLDHQPCQSECPSECQSDVKPDKYIAYTRKASDGGSVSGRMRVAVGGGDGQGHIIVS